MKLNAILRQLAMTFDVTKQSSFTHNPEVTEVQFVSATEAVATHRLYLQSAASQTVQLSYDWRGHRQIVGTVSLGAALTTVIAAQNQLLKLLVTLGSRCIMILSPKISLISSPSTRLRQILIPRSRRPFDYWAIRWRLLT